MIKRIFIVLYVLAGLFGLALASSSLSAHNRSLIDGAEWVITAFVWLLPMLIVFALHYIIGLNR